MKVEMLADGGFRVFDGTGNGRAACRNMETAAAMIASYIEELDIPHRSKRSDEDQLIAILRTIGKEVTSVRGDDKSVAGLVRQELEDRQKSFQDAHAVQELRHKQEVERLRKLLANPCRFPTAEGPCGNCECCVEIERELNRQ